MYEEEKILIMNNFTNQNQEFEVNFLIDRKELLLGNIEIENDISN